MKNTYQEYIHQSRYARWDHNKKRRETWEETVGRYIEFFAKRSSLFPVDEIQERNSKH